MMKKQNALFSSVTPVEFRCVKNKQDLAKSIQGDELLRAEDFIKDFFTAKPENNDYSVDTQ